MSLTNKGLAKKEWIRVVFVVSLCDSTLFHLVGLASHGALISADIDTFEKDAISRDSHALFDLDNITNDKVCDRDSLSEAFGSSETSTVLNSCLGDEFLELLLLRVVVSRSDTDNDEYSTVDGDSIDPSMAPTLLVDTDYNVDCSEDDQHDKCVVT